MRWLKHPAKRRDDDGFTLIEVIVSTAVFSLAIVGVGALSAQLLDLSSRATVRLADERQVQSALADWYSITANATKVIEAGPHGFTLIVETPGECERHSWVVQPGVSEDNAWDVGYRTQSVELPEGVGCPDLGDDAWTGTATTIPVITGVGVGAAPSVFTYGWPGDVPMPMPGEEAPFPVTEENPYYDPAKDPSLLCRIGTVTLTVDWRTRDGSVANQSMTAPLPRTPAGAAC